MFVKNVKIEQFFTYFPSMKVIVGYGSYFKILFHIQYFNINFCAVQRGALGSFKPLSDGVMYLYLYINIHTDSRRRPETNFGCSLCKNHPCNELCFAHFHAKIQNILKVLRKPSLAT